mmetsp:Transcript_9225/g.26375  ORF Transcript_9225/g.26375 Transcript_9225/m.26375 type:complete len:122 (+) Transcript_9225:94-459(+)
MAAASAAAAAVSSVSVLLLLLLLLSFSIAPRIGLDRPTGWGGLPIDHLIDWFVHVPSVRPVNRNEASNTTQRNNNATATTHKRRAFIGTARSCISLHNQNHHLFKQLIHHINNKQQQQCPI